MNTLFCTVVLALWAMAAFPNAIAAPSPVPLALEAKSAQLRKRATASIAATCRDFTLVANTLTAHRNLQHPQFWRQNLQRLTRLVRRQRQRIPRHISLLGGVQLTAQCVNNIGGMVVTRLNLDAGIVANDGVLACA
ncbi:hypothetical protein B0H13DRAFT_1876312 [Mycena leptocephala]|nr:hypothetical protein B0H13DRAFT_1876312 [Mycena leptocephala]